MPHTLIYQPTLFDELISLDRIGSYRNTFRTTTDVELMGVYLWNKQVCATYWPLLTTLEIAIRNSIDRELSALHGPWWWKSNHLKTVDELKGLPQAKPKIDVVGNLKGAEKRFNTEQTRKFPTNSGARRSATHHDVIAYADMSTWEYLLDPQFNHRNLIWPKLLGKVFKGPWPSTSMTKTLEHARDNLISLRLLRNRIAHHEPVWKYFTVSDEATALSYLQGRLAALEEYLRLIDPELHRLMAVNGYLRAAHRVTTVRAIRYAQHKLAPKRIRSMRQLAEIVGACGHQNELQPAVMYLGGKARFSIVPG